jgi:hypothetical protein
MVKRYSPFIGWPSALAARHRTVYSPALSPPSTRTARTDGESTGTKISPMRTSPIGPMRETSEKRSSTSSVKERRISVGAALSESSAAGVEPVRCRCADAGEGARRRRSAARSALRDPIGFKAFLRVGGRGRGAEATGLAPRRKPRGGHTGCAAPPGGDRGTLEGTG